MFKKEKILYKILDVSTQVCYNCSVDGLRRRPHDDKS
jgi:hypothetical protein